MMIFNKFRSFLSALKEYWNEPRGHEALHLLNVEIAEQDLRQRFIMLEMDRRKEQKENEREKKIKMKLRKKNISKHFNHINRSVFDL